MGKTIAKFAAAWALAVFAIQSSVPGGVNDWIIDAIYRIFAGFPAIAVNVDRVYWATVEVVGQGYAATLFLATLLAPLGAAVRMVARARIRAGAAEFLDRARSWVSRHPRVTRWLVAAPTLLWILRLYGPRNFAFNHPVEWLWDIGHASIAMAFTAWAMIRMTRKGVAEFLAPTVSGGEREARFELLPDEIVFDAVAVTRRTLALVAAFTAVTLAVPAYIATRPILDLFHDRSIFYLAFGYTAFAAASALAFRKASRISVGVDGVHVRGTCRARFFAYRDIDSARVNGGDIELVKRGRVALRLQLHGEDAARRDAVLTRITENLARVQEGRGAVAAQLVATSSPDDLARVAHGAADYRMATLTREQLWALVEGPEIEASARQAAAEALIASGDGRERARLRVAADHCAEPNVRVALAELAGGAGDEAEAASRSARAARVV